jgi:enoyl-CoA hydratase/carnithine racemase
VLFSLDQTITPLELAQLVRQGGVQEQFSALTGDSCCVVNFQGQEISPEIYQVLFTILPHLPCPTLAVTADRQMFRADDLLGEFDVVLSSEEEVEQLRSRIKAFPMASALMVQLLRNNEKASDFQALYAESLAFSTLQGGGEFRKWLEGRQAPDHSGEECDLPVRMERDGNHLEIVLTDPGNRNAFSVRMRDALYEALQLLDLDPDIDSCRISGEGSCFCVGGDLGEFGLASDTAASHLVRSTRNVAHLLIRHAHKIECEVHRACIGSGIELPAFSGRLIAREGTFFELPELSMGLLPGAGGTVSILRRIGRQRLAWWILSGRKINTETALRWKLVDEVKPG